MAIAISKEFLTVHVSVSEAEAVDVEAVSRSEARSAWQNNGFIPAPGERGVVSRPPGDAANVPAGLQGALLSARNTG